MQGPLHSVEAGLGIRFTGCDPGCTCVVTAVTANDGVLANRKVLGNRKEGGNGWQYSVRGTVYRGVQLAVGNTSAGWSAVRRLLVLKVENELKRAGRKRGGHDAFLAYPNKARLEVFGALHGVYGCRGGGHGPYDGDPLRATVPALPRTPPLARAVVFEEWLLLMHKHQGILTRATFPCLYRSWCLLRAGTECIAPENNCSRRFCHEALHINLVCFV